MDKLKALINEYKFLKDESKKELEKSKKQNYSECVIGENLIMFRLYSKVLEDLKKN
jgi:hypothetical protein